MGALGDFEVVHGLVVYRHALEVDDADVLVGGFVDLSLLELHWREGRLSSFGLRAGKLEKGRNG